MSGARFDSLADAAGRFGPCALAIGNFDGVHVGHQVLLSAVARYAAANDLVPAALTFDPHPVAVVAPQHTPEMLCTVDERVRLLMAAGAKQVLVLPFTKEVAQLSPEEFVGRFLVEALSAKAVFVGENFRFGHRQAGDTPLLARLAQRQHFYAEFLKPVRVRGEVVSSSLIRAAVRSGKVSRACRLLGRPFALKGPVVSGLGIGTRQTVPTLNLEAARGLVLPRGVFVTETFSIEDHISEGPGGNRRRWPSITNVGTRPTFAGQEVTIETFLLEPLTTPSPRNIEVQFRRFIRPEKHFAGAAELKSQILRDVARANEFWRRLAILKS